MKAIFYLICIIEMADTNEEKKKPYQQSCVWLMFVVVALFLVLVYMALYRDKSAGKNSMLGGKWKARGGCACMPPK